VSLSNFNISVLGEVNNPGQYTIANEKVSVLDALVLARDLTIDAKRDNVMLIRDSAGVKRFARFDLTRSDLFNSPYFYLQQGDLVYVEPVKEKQTSKDAVTQRTIGYVTAGTGLLLSIVSIIIALSR
jgi:polysaccharide export outer membrane protein